MRTLPRSERLRGVRLLRARPASAPSSRLVACCSRIPSRSESFRDPSASAIRAPPRSKRLRDPNAFARSELLRNPNASAIRTRPRRDGTAASSSPRSAGCFSGRRPTDCRSWVRGSSLLLLPDRRTGSRADGLSIRKSRPPWRGSDLPPSKRRNWNGKKSPFLGALCCF